ncbi:MAG: CbiX/SirB N-terminal domain-containing protein [Bacillota bacterium]|nr:CbiX/SirB N-terminal domain-containing protein [Bacillota bacterium]
MKTALIILGHGSKAPEATETLAAVTAMVREKVSYDRVEYASLQLSEPLLPAVIKALVEAGMERILVIPFLIAAGQHVKTDIPEELVVLREKHPGVEMHLGSPLGADERLAEILLDRVEEMERSI